MIIERCISYCEGQGYSCMEGLLFHVFVRGCFRLISWTVSGLMPCAMMIWPCGCGSKPCWYYFGIGAPPILVYFSGDRDVHWGYGLLTHGHVLSCVIPDMNDACLPGQISPNPYGLTSPQGRAGKQHPTKDSIGRLTNRITTHFPRVRALYLGEDQFRI